MKANHKDQISRFAVHCGKAKRENPALL